MIEHDLYGDELRDKHLVRRFGGLLLIKLWAMREKKDVSNPYQVPRPTVAFGMSTPVELQSHTSNPPAQTADELIKSLAVTPEQVEDFNIVLAAVAAGSPDDALPES